MKINKIVLGILLSMTTTGTLWAGEVNVRPVISVGAGFGGDTLVSIDAVQTTSSYYGGSVISKKDVTVDLNAGDGIFVNGGVLVDFSDIPVEVLAQIGWFSASDGVDGYDASFVRYPIDLIAYYKINSHRIGAGMAYHMSPKLEDYFDLEYKDAIGGIIDYTWAGENIRFFLRYTMITYKEETFSYNGYSFNSDIETKGDSFSLGISYAFGK